jgi:TPR repeat protein
MKFSNIWPVATVIILGLATVRNELVAGSGGAADTLGVSGAPATKLSLPTAGRLDREAARSPADALRVALAYSNGTDGAVQDYETALVYFCRAADAGNAEAMNKIGNSYELVPCPD